jgi:AcrR family transcriptional regulator
MSLVTETASAVRSRPGGRAARVRTAVLAATVEEFVELGYGGLSAARIAERAGVNRSTIHRRWGSVDELLADALVGSADTAVPMPDSGNVRDDLRLLLRSIAGFIDGDVVRPRIRALVGDAGRSPVVSAIARSVFTTRFALGEAIIARAVARGEVRGDVAPATILAALVGPLYVRGLLTDERIDDAFIGDVLGLVLDGAASPGPGAPSV